MNSFVAVASLTLTFLLLPASGTSDNLIVNGGFEINSSPGSSFLDSWTNVGSAGWYSYNQQIVNAENGAFPPVDVGTWSVVPNAFQASDPAILSQVVTTTAGDCYTVSFDYTTDTLTGDLALTWQFGSSTPITLPLTSLTDNSFVSYTGPPLPGSGSDTFSISGWYGGGSTNNKNGYPGLDQVSVVLAADYVYDEGSDTCIAVSICDSIYDDCMSGVSYVTDCCNNNGGSYCEANEQAYAAQCLTAINSAASCTTLDCCHSTFTSVTGVSTDTAVQQQSTCGGFVVSG